jgi:hypothetical protein
MRERLIEKLREKECREDNAYGKERRDAILTEEEGFDGCYMESTLREKE